MPITGKQIEDGMAHELLYLATREEVRKAIAPILQRISEGTKTLKYPAVAKRIMLEKIEAAVADIIREHRGRISLVEAINTEVVASTN